MSGEAGWDDLKINKKTIEFLKKIVRKPQIE